MDLDADAMLGAMYDEAARLYRESTVLKKQEKTVQLEKTRLAAQLANIEKEEHEMKAQLARVNREIAVSQQRIATFDSLSLLLARVPVEIWRLVFSWYREIIERRFRRAGGAIWQLGHIFFGGPGARKATGIVAVDVAFHGSMLDDHKLSSALLNILARHSARWERFEANWEGDMIVFEALSDIAGCLNRLRYLKLLSFSTEDYPDEDYSNTWPLAMWDAFQTAPLLEEVFLTSEDEDYSGSPVIRLPPTVKRLRIAAQPKDIVRALHDAPDVVQLAIREVHDGGRSVDGGFVWMNTIKQLHLEHPWPKNRMICRLRTPALQQLSIAGSVTELPQFLKQSGCRLQRLTLTVESASDWGGAEAVLAVLRGLQQLPHLRLDCRWYDPLYQQTMEVLVPQLTVSTGRPTVCPNLVSLDVRMTWKLPHVNWEDAFCEMVESRRGSLKILRVEGMHALSAASTRRLESLEQEGIMVIKGWS
ncbi:hypothetical protein R3P38DRAFT_3257854 [Favolaschia claudopus]|uniref:F-box protein n=1 Tax=Favolaschia claudopus TaxID=2862362 RepID=A0AAW0D605_9AGAR